MGRGECLGLVPQTGCTVSFLSLRLLICKEGL